ncbi:hypothetical protein ACLKA7_002622 [Drosophila subpalustris]
MPRSETKRVSAAPKCKVDNYGLARKNSLIGIAQRLNARSECLREEKRTTWLTSEFERIGLESSHIQELGIDIHHFFDPDFDRTPRGKHQEDHPIPGTAIEQDLELESIKVEVSNAAQRAQRLSSLVCSEKSEESEVHHGALIIHIRLLLPLSGNNSELERHGSKAAVEIANAEQKDSE